MALNTSIRGLQIKDAFFGAALARNGADGDIMDVQVDDSTIEVSGDALQVKDDGITGAKLHADVAGDALAQDGSGNLDVQVDDSTIEVSGDALQVKDDGITGAKLASAVAGNGLAQDGSGNLDLDLNELSDTAVDVANDSFAFIDNDDNGSKKESIADLVTAMAGSGLTATNGVLSVDSITDNIVETDIQVENESSNCDGAETDFTLDNTPVANSVQVFLNGLLQEEGSGKDYTLSGTTVSFATAPESGDILIIHYITNN